MGNIPYTQDEKDFIERNHGLYPRKYLADKINKKFWGGKQVRTPYAIYRYYKTRKLSLKYREGYVTLSQASEMLNIPLTTLRSYFKRPNRTVKCTTTGAGGLRLVNVDDLDKLKSLYPDVPSHFISTVQAADRLGQNYNAITRVCKDGKIPCIKSNKGSKSYFIDPAIIEIAVKQMKQSGLLQVNWKKVRQEYEGRNNT